MKVTLVALCADTTATSSLRCEPRIVCTKTCPLTFSGAPTCGMLYLQSAQQGGGP